MDEHLAIWYCPCGSTELTIPMAMLVNGMAPVEKCRMCSQIVVPVPISAEVHQHVESRGKGPT